MAVHCFGEFELDTALYELRRDGEVLETGARVFDVLVYLIEHRDRLVSKDELVERVWGVTAMSGSSVPTCIASVRKALGDDPASPRFIETQRGRGYRFVAEVTRRLEPGELETAAPSRKPLGFSNDTGRSIFVDRESELAAIYAAFERTLSGVPQLVLVTGEPGIGKTRLLEEFAFTSRDDGAVVLLGRSIEGEGAPAFWPWVQVIRTCVESSDESSLPAALGHLLPSLLQMVPELTTLFPDQPPPPSLDPEQARFRMFDAVTALLTRTASERPLVILLDDLHRADPASLRLLQFAARELRDTPVLFIATYRDPELHSDADHALMLAELAREEPTRCIQLGGISRNGVARLLDEAAPTGSSPRSTLVNALYDQTGGNPFFLTQVVHLLRAEGRLDDIEAADSWQLHLPGGIRDAVARQLDGLPRETRRVLEVAAVAGREFESAIIADASDTDAAAAFAMLQPAVEGRIVTGVPGQVSRFRFSHIILRDCIYDELPALDRIELHRRIAEGLEAFYAGHLGPRAAELAYHFYEAIPSIDSERAIHYSVQAAQWADSRLAYEDVPQHYRRTLRLAEQRVPPDLLEQARLLITLGESEIRAGERGRAQETFKAAVTISREINEPEILAQAALGLAPGFFAIEVGVYDPILVSLLEEALRELPPGDSPLRAQVIARLSIALGWTDEHERRTRLASEAITMSRNLSDPRTIAKALIAQHGTLWDIDCREQRTQIISSLDRISALTIDHEIELMLRLFRIVNNLESGKINAVASEMETFGRISTELRQPALQWYSQMFVSMKAILEGHFDEITELAQVFLDTGMKAADQNAIHAHAAQIAIRNYELGRAREIIPIVRNIVDRFPTVAGWRCTLAFLLAQSDQMDDAHTEFERLAAFDFNDFYHRETDSISLNLLATIAHHLNDTARSEILYKRLLPLADSHTVIAYAVAYFGPVADRLGQIASTLENWPAAFQHFEKAAHLCQKVGSPPWYAHVLCHHAEARKRRAAPGDEEIANSLLNRGSQLATRHGMTHLLRRIDKTR